MNETKDISVQFTLDTKGNPAIFEFGCTYEGDVPKFHENIKIPILGCKGLRVIDFEPELLKKEIKANIRRRYFYKKNQKIIAKPSAYVESIHKKDSEDEPQQLFYKIVHDEADLRSEGAGISSSHSQHVQNVADLNRAVYDNPKDLESWLELVERQQVNLSESEESKDTPGNSKSDRFVVLERQLAVVERAAEKNPGNLRLRLLKAAMYEYATELIAGGACRNSDALDALTQQDKVAREWYDLVRVCPQFVSVWRGHLAYLRGRFALFGNIGGDGQKESFSRIDNLYKRALDTLSGLVAGRIVSHRPTENTADETVGKFCSLILIITQHVYY